MSEQDNVGTIKSIYDAFGRGDVASIVDRLTDDVRWVSRLESVVPWSGTFTKADVHKFFSAIFESVDVTDFTPQDFVAQADTVVSIGEFGCKVRATGKSSHTRWAFVWKLRAGKVYSYEQFHDPGLAAAFQ